jgi:hypothetical protein
MRSAASQLVHDLRNALASLDLNLQALGRSGQTDPRNRHFLGARRALAEGTRLLDELTAALREDRDHVHGTPQEPH